jgi:glucan 1,3-beta-glucosidase
MTVALLTVYLSVNIGGWLVLEPFTSPALYEPFNGTAIDEWTLSTSI